EGAREFEQTVDVVALVGPGGYARGILFAFGIQRMDQRIKLIELLEVHCRECVVDAPLDHRTLGAVERVDCPPLTIERRHLEDLPQQSPVYAATVAPHMVGEARHTRTAKYVFVQKEALGHDGCAAARAADKIDEPLQRLVRNHPATCVDAGHRCRRADEVHGATGSPAASRCGESGAPWMSD